MSAHTGDQTPSNGSLSTPSSQTSTTRSGNGSSRVEDNAQSLLFLETLYEQYQKSPDTLSPEWREYFEQLDEESNQDAGQTLRPQRKPFSIFNPPSMSEGGLRRP